MPISREQLETLQRLAERAAEVLNGVDPAAWPDAATRERLEAVVVYARLVLEPADAMLVPDPVNDLAGAFQEWIDGTNAIIATPDAWIERMLAGLGRLPAAHGRDLEQAVKDGAATFQRSAQQRLASLSGEVDTARNEVNQLLSELASRRAEIDAVVQEAREQQDQAAAERLAQIDARTREISVRVEQEVQRIDALVVEQTEAFRKVQDERAEEHRQREKDYEERIDNLERASRERADALVNEIEEMKDRSAALVGIIAANGTAGRYREEFTEQRETADFWRWVTVVFGVLAVIAAILAAFDNKAATVGAKLGIAILLGGVAAYTARQSSRHRSREEHARQLQLDLASFPAFIEALPSDAQETATVWMAERSFLGARTVEEDEDSGPGVLSQAIQARRKKAEGEHAAA